MRRAAAAMAAGAALVACLFPSFDPYVGAGTSVDAAADAEAAADAAAPTCDADVESDPQNCGRCGRDCRGGPCGAGVCGAAPFTATPGSPIDLATDELGVYVTSRDLASGALGRVTFFSYDGATKRTIATAQDDPRAIVVVTVGGHRRAYWTNEGARSPSSPEGAPNEAHPSGGSVAGADLDDGGAPAILVPNLSDPWGIASDGVSLYFTTRGATCVGGGTSATCSASDGAVWACALPDCASPKPLATGEAGPRRLVVGGGALFWSVTSTGAASPLPIRTLALGTAGANDLPGTGAVVDIGLGPGAIYASTVAVDAGLARVPLGGGLVERAPLTMQGPRGVAADATFAFVLDRDFGTGGALYRIDEAAVGNAGAVRSLASRTGEAIALGAAGADDGVFFTYTAGDGSGTIQRVTR